MRYPVISVTLSDSPYQIRPNPVRRNEPFVVLVDEPDSASVTLYRADGGRVLFRKLATTYQSITFTLGDAPAVGLYILTVEERGQTRQYRLLVE